MQPRTMPDISSRSKTLSIKQAVVLWALFVLVFLFFGGLGAGLTALIYEALIQDEFGDVKYTALFGVCGYIAYRLAQHLAGLQR